jgi:Periplasmic protein involved in polysaccharide export
MLQFLEMINNPGTYTYKDQMSLKDLILESGGVNKDIFRYKIEIARVDPRVLDDNTMAESFVLDMRNDYSISSSENLFNINEDSNFLLMPYDHVFIRPDPYFGMQKKVYVAGQVYYPGEYAILSTDETIYDIINRAGGLKPRAYEIASQFTRDGNNIIIDIGKILKKPKSKMNLKVQDSDQIFIASKPDMIRVVGEVSSPGFYNYSKGSRIRSVINEAGGFTPDANFENIFIKFPNGKSKQYNRFFSNPKVLDGSIITVGKKPESEPLDKTEFLKEISTIVGNFIQVDFYNHYSSRTSKLFN